MQQQTTGTITQIIGAVLDIKFPEGHLPQINEAVTIATRDGGSLTVEVSHGSTRWWKLCVKKHNIVRGASHRA